MARIVYVGSRAGLRPKGRTGPGGGDMNSPFDYLVFCHCDGENETLLGPLGRFQPNADGLRTPYCPLCEHAILIGRDGQIIRRFRINLTKTG